MASDRRAPAEAGHVRSLLECPCLASNRHHYARDVDECRDEIEASRASWLAASRRASELANELFQPGDGYGDPDARAQDEHRLDSAWI